MNIKELEEIMIAHSVVLRAIPQTTIGIYEKEQISKYPDGTVKYLDNYKREMLIVERTPKNAGEFILECEKHTGSTVRFTGNMFFETIEQAIGTLLDINNGTKHTGGKL